MKKLLTEIELDVLAAKAAGIPGAVGQNETFMIAENLRGPSDEATQSRRALGLQGGRGWWSPMQDDGDALRLAVKFNLDIKYRSGPNGIYVTARGNYDDGESATEIFECDGRGATRRAIVRAVIKTHAAMQDKRDAAAMGAANE